MSNETTKIIKTVRLNEDESHRINAWLNENNKCLEDNGEPPLIASEVVHLLIAIGLPCLKINERGEVVFNE